LVSTYLLFFCFGVRVCTCLNMLERWGTSSPYPLKTVPLEWVRIFPGSSKTNTLGSSGRMPCITRVCYPAAVSEMP
ncbi:hypothetical protein BDR03DRAFT_956561, partial [Suillus americanus]